MLTWGATGHLEFSQQIGNLSELKISVEVLLSAVASPLSHLHTSTTPILDAATARIHQAAYPL